MPSPLKRPSLGRLLAALRSPPRVPVQTGFTTALADLVVKISLSDEPAPDAGAACPASCLVDLLGKFCIANEPASDLEKAGSTDRFIAPVELLTTSDAASTDAFPGGWTRPKAPPFSGPARSSSRSAGPWRSRSSPC